MRYNRKGKEAERIFVRHLTENGFYKIHNTLYVRYCFSQKSALSCRDKIHKMIPDVKCDISIIVSGDSQNDLSIHHLNRYEKGRSNVIKPSFVEFF